MPAWETALSKQLDAYIAKLSKYDSVDDALGNLSKDFPKIETFYSFTALKKDLLKFADIAIDEVLRTKENFAEQDIFEYPQVILDVIDAKTKALLQGIESLDNDQMKFIPSYLKNYKGLDLETSAQVNTIIKNNASEGLDEVIKILSASISELAKNRATMIAETEVGYAVEESRFHLYLKEEYKFEKWLTVKDETTCSICKGRSAAGVVAIGTYSYNAHPQDRCTKIYGKNKEDIS